MSRTKYEIEFAAVEKDQYGYRGYESRANLVKKYGFSIPTANAIERLRKYGPFLEVGAGTGYWSYEMKERGIDVIATDKSAPINNSYTQFKDTKPYTEIVCLYGMDAIEQYPNRTVFMSWPCYCDSWSYNLLKAYTGKYFVYVGEGPGGCTGTDEFHDELHVAWKDVDYIRIPQWSGIHDSVYVYERDDA